MTAQELGKITYEKTDFQIGSQSKKNFIQFLNVTFHLQLLQNIGYIPHVVQYILEPILHPLVCVSHSPTPILPFPPSTPLVTISWFSMSVSLFLPFYVH